MMPQPTPVIPLRKTILETNMNDLDQLEADSIYIFREARHHFEKLAMLWSLGKDSNVMIWLAKKAYLGTVPFPVMHLDTGDEFPEAYAFREQYSKRWDLDLIADDCPPLEDMDQSLPPNSRFVARKSAGLKQAIKRYQVEGVFVGIRRDEQSTRAKERVFSPRDEDGKWDFRDQPAEFWDNYHVAGSDDGHVRIHPLLQWTEVDIWRYIQRENIPVVPLYFAKNGKRFRSLGEASVTRPIDSNADTLDGIIDELSNTNTDEREGRTMDRESEDAFERLRQDGYM